MTTGALIFMLLVWSFVIGLAGWAYSRLLKAPRLMTPMPKH